MISREKIYSFKSFFYIGEEEVVKHFERKKSSYTKSSSRKLSNFNDSLIERIELATEIATPEQAQLLDNIYAKIINLERSKQVQVSKFEGCIMKMEKQLEQKKRKNLNLKHQLNYTIKELNNNAQWLHNQQRSFKKISVQKIKQQTKTKLKIPKCSIKMNAKKSTLNTFCKIS